MIRPFFICLIYTLLSGGVGYAQRGPLTFAQLRDSMAVHPKPVVIELYTDWCMYCRMQDRHIRRDTILQQLLSEKYYYVAFNAESRQPVIFNDTPYTFIPYGTQGIHGLATRLMPHCLSYPSWIILNTALQPERVHAGMLKSSALRDFLQ